MVCDQHGGLRPKSGGARERLIMTADQAAQMLVRMMEDTEVPSCRRHHRHLARRRCEQ